MCCALVESVCICGELGFEHQLIEFGDSEGAALAAGKDLSLEQIAAVNVDHHLGRTLEIYVEKCEPVVALKVLEALFDHKCFAEDAGGFGQCHRQASLQRCAMCQLGVVVGVTQFVSGGLRRIDTACPVEKDQRPIADEWGAKGPAAFALAWLGIDPAAIDGAVD